MLNLSNIVTVLEQLAPPHLAADWDNVGLLVETQRQEISRVMTCLTLTPAVAKEAVEQNAHLIVTHHPLPFRPVDRITTDTAAGSVLLELLRAGIAVWSGHTAWDSAAGGINALLAEQLSLTDVAPIEPDTTTPELGFGRMGTAPAHQTVGDIARQLTTSLDLPGCHLAGPADRVAGRVGIVCGSGGDTITTVAAAGCQTLVTGEIKLHNALDAIAHGLAVVAVGHHASERFALEVLVERLTAGLPELHCWASTNDTDPLLWMPTAP